MPERTHTKRGCAHVAVSETPTSRKRPKSRGLITDFVIHRPSAVAPSPNTEDVNALWEGLWSVVAPTPNRWCRGTFIKRRQCSLFPPSAEVQRYRFANQVNTSLSPEIWWDHPLLARARDVILEHASWPTGSPYFLHINLMPDGAGVGAHSDADPSIIQPHSDIVAITLTTRPTDYAPLVISDRYDRADSHTFKIRGGDVYVMRAGMQESTFVHAIRPRSTPGSRRISITGRMLPIPPVV